MRILDLLLIGSVVFWFTVWVATGELYPIRCFGLLLLFFLLSEIG